MKVLLKKQILVFTMLLFAFGLTGCGKDKEIDAYMQTMNTFYENMNSLNDELNGIDPNSESASTQMLECLDKINAEVATLNEMSIPSRYDQVNEFKDAAVSNMDQAVSLYHEAFKGEEYNNEKASEAATYYSKANKQISYIAQVLQIASIGTTQEAENSTEASTERSSESQEDLGLETNFDEDDTVFYDDAAAPEETIQTAAETE